MVLEVIDVVIGIAVVTIVLAILGALLSWFKVPWVLIMDLLAGFVGIALVLTFVGILILWIMAPPLIVIAIFVALLLIHDWVRTLRYGEGGVPGND